MKTHDKQPQRLSRTLDANPKASRQAPIDVILQKYADRNEVIQQKAIFDSDGSILRYRQTINQIKAISGEGKREMKQKTALHDAALGSSPDHHKDRDLDDDTLIGDLEAKIEEVKGHLTRRNPGKDPIQL